MIDVKDKILKGVGFSYGYGKDIKTADAALFKHKEERTKAGERIPESHPRGVSVRVREEGHGYEEGKDVVSRFAVTPQELVDSLEKPAQLRLF